MTAICKLRFSYLGLLLLLPKLFNGAVLTENGVMGNYDLELAANVTCRY
jgi:hypothetical protein